MSNRRTDTVRRFYAAANQGDVSAEVAGFHPEIEFDWTDSISPYSGRYVGVEGIESWLAEARDGFSDFAFEPEELIDAPEAEQIVAVLRIRGRSRTTGMELSAVGAQLWTFEHGRARHMRVFQSKREALEAIHR